jgi:hypothetical protein
VKRLALLAVLLALFACKDPYSFETKPDPPPPPKLTQPAYGWISPDFAYPQDIELAWDGLPGTLFYQVGIYREDSTLQSRSLAWSSERLPYARVTARLGRYGRYYWRVRAASRNWNNYTNWSAASKFALPNPAR